MAEKILYVSGMIFSICVVVGIVIGLGYGAYIYIDWNWADLLAFPLMYIWISILYFLSRSVNDDGKF